MIIKKKAQEQVQFQVNKLIYEKIRTHEFDPGDKIPSGRELRFSLGVCRLSVRNANRDLIKEGMVERASGQGAFVTENISFIKFLRKNIMRSTIFSAKTTASGSRWL